MAEIDGERRWWYILEEAIDFNTLRNIVGEKILHQEAGSVRHLSLCLARSPSRLVNFWVCTDFEMTNQRCVMVSSFLNDTRLKICQETRTRVIEKIRITCASLLNDGNKGIKYERGIHRLYSKEHVCLVVPGPPLTLSFSRSREEPYTCEKKLFLLESRLFSLWNKRYF